MSRLRSVAGDLVRIRLRHELLPKPSQASMLPRINTAAHPKTIFIKRKTRPAGSQRFTAGRAQPLAPAAAPN
jgi:transposase